MIKFKKCANVENLLTCCVKCALRKDERKCAKAKCNGGYFVEVPDKPKRKRAGKYERLLKALLRCDRIWRTINMTDFEEVTESQYKELQAIKEAMEKKGGSK